MSQKCDNNFFFDAVCQKVYVKKVLELVKLSSLEFTALRKWSEENVTDLEHSYVN